MIDGNFLKMFGNSLESIQKELLVRQAIAGMFYGVIATIAKYDLPYNSETILKIMKESITLAKEIEPKANAAFNSDDLLDKELLNYARILLK